MPYARVEDGVIFENIYFSFCGAVATSTNRGGLGLLLSNVLELTTYELIPIKEKRTLQMVLT